MGTTLNIDTYKRIVQEDIDWLEKQPHSLEKDHILSMLKNELLHLPLYYNSIKHKNHD